MRRREFIAGATALAAWPVAARAQQRKTFRIGIVETISAELNAANLAGFRRGSRDLGYVEGRNLVLEYRSADGDASRFPALISELIDLKVDLIVTRGTPAALAAKRATSTIPIVMASLGEPLLVVESLSDDIEGAFAAPSRDFDAITVGLEAVTQRHRKLIAELAAKHRLPAIYDGRSRAPTR
jgi:putative ABC transport system substrate-binding protein